MKHNSKLTKEQRRRKRKDFLSSLCFMAPSLIGVGVFFVVPFGVVIYGSVTDVLATGKFVGLQYFISLFNNSAFRLACRNTLRFSLTAVPLAVILALVLAVMLEARIPGKSFFRSFFLSPMMVPVASIVLIWQVLFNYNGTVNELLALFGGDKIDWLQSSYAPLVVTILFLWKNLGYNMILFMSALGNVPVQLLEVADVEGAGALYKFFNIKLRYITPTLFFVLIFSLINSFKIFREVYLLAGSYPSESLYTLQHFMNNCFQYMDYQKLYAAAVIMAVVMVVVIWFLFKLEDHFDQDIEG